MTSPDNSLTIAITAYIASSPSGDELTRTIKEAIRNNAKSIAEMNEVGFNTSSMFDRDYLAQSLEASAPFLVTSLYTATVYLVILRKRVGNTFLAAVQIYYKGLVSNKFNKMTLVPRTVNNSIHANPGW